MVFSISPLRPIPTIWKLIGPLLLLVEAHYATSYGDLSLAQPVSLASLSFVFPLTSNI